MSYHKLKICKHHVGSPWKLQEEVLEYIDAVSNDNPVMAANELSDLYGVIDEEAKKYGLIDEVVPFKVKEKAKTK